MLLVFAYAQSALAADASPVVTRLQTVSGIVKSLTDSLGGDGKFSDLKNALSIPFLGGAPASLDDQMFDQLLGTTGLGKLNAITANTDQKVSEVKSLIGTIAGATFTFRCNADGAVCADDAEVGTVTAIDIDLKIGGTGDPDPENKKFDSLNLPSTGFKPSTTGEFKIDLSWSINLSLHVTSDDVTVSKPADPDTHMLELGIGISIPKAAFGVNLGALIVEATVPTGIDAPGFNGTVWADLDDAGNFDFGFKNAKFEALWHLATKDNSPLRGVEADLHVKWALAEVTESGPNAAVDPGGLTITVEHVKITMPSFMKDGIQSVAVKIRDVVHPIRQATSPMLEPIPGLSELSSILDGKDVTMLRLMGFGEGVDPGSGLDKFPYEKIEEAIKRIQFLDDATVNLVGGDGTVDLGSFTLASTEALKSDGAAAIQEFKKIIEKCDVCATQLGNLLEKVNGSRDPEAKQGFQFAVPVLSKPESLAGLILGRDVDLITFDTGFLGYHGNLNAPLARFWIFAVSIKGEVEAGIHLKGGVDTAGIIAAIKDGGQAKDLFNGLYLENPGDGDSILRLMSKAGLNAEAGYGGVDVSLRGSPEPNISFKIPNNTKLRPALLEGTADSFACKLVDGGDASFKVQLSAFFNYFLGSEEVELADHVFLTKEDICDKDANARDVAYDDGNSNVMIDPLAFDGLAADEPALIKVYMLHDATGEPRAIVVEGNNGRRKEIPAHGIQNVRLQWSFATRPVYVRVVKNDDKQFEKRVFIDTGTGEDDVVVDSSAFGFIDVGDGNDSVLVTSGVNPSAPSIPVSGGKGDDLIIGGDKADFLQGDQGNDRIEGGGGPDRLDGGSDIDVLIDGSIDTDASDGISRNCFVGGTEGDLLISGIGGDMLFGDETVFAGENAVGCAGGNPDPNEPAVPGDGNDTIITGGGPDFVIAGGGNDTVMLHGDKAWDGNDPAWRIGATIHGNDGNDNIRTGFGKDTIHGGPGNDGVVSDTGLRGSSRFSGDKDQIWGGVGADDIEAGDGPDLIFGDDGHEACSAGFEGEPVETTNAGGADVVHAGPGDDVVALEAGDDFAYGEGSDDAICGHAGIDTIHGDGDPEIEYELGTMNPGEDTLFGGSFSDNLYGGERNDLVMGNSASDFLYGEDGDDRLVGGSNKPGVFDTGDAIEGGNGDDIIIGDNGFIHATTPRISNVADLFADDSSLGGPDLIDGGRDADRIFGGLAGDTIAGGRDDDHLEGNNGDDNISGNAGDDDIIGGTSDLALPGALTGTQPADASDVGETLLSGGPGLDVIIGDNGNITRVPGTDPILGGPARNVVLFDRDRTGAALQAVSGPDYIEGNGESDRLYGQGGDDYAKGNDADDFIQGNQGSDRLEGNAGEDDLIGGGSFFNTPGVGDSDGNDHIAGGDGADVLLGDNAIITRATTGAGTGFDWDSVANSWLGQTARRSITLLDKAALSVANAGADVLSGGAGSDVLFGQDGADRLYGGAHDDAMEGNGGGDVLYGDQNAPLTGLPHESSQADVDGPAGPDGQDDQIGGSSWIRATLRNGAINGQRDGGDELHGDGNADVQLGDNGRILRRIVNGQYATFQALTGKPTIVRQASQSGAAATALPARYDVAAASTAAVWGADTLYGDGGDDVQLAGDGNDTLYGGANDDDMYGELGDDRMFGEAGEDAMVGDRGVITNRLVATPGAAFSVTSPPRLSYTPFAAHPLDRRVDLNDDGDGAPLESPGMASGGNDHMRGGADHDAMHGAAGNDLMNGDSGGDYLFGADGVDVMWGGKGRECADPADLACNADRGVNDAYVDYLFGGNGLKTDPVTGGADILDFRPRPGIDPASWFEGTNTRAADPVADHQHHQGIDWIYGGWDRDVLQADIADNGPNDGDRLLDWTGAYNLYTHCPSAYGGFNDVRTFSPTVQSFLQQLAYALGAGKSLADVQAKGTSGYNELALVYNADVKTNSGTAYPGTPGHFETFSCAP